MKAYLLYHINNGKWQEIVKIYEKTRFFKKCLQYYVNYAIIKKVESYLYLKGAQKSVCERKVSRGPSSSGGEHVHHVGRFN